MLASASPARLRLLQAAGLAPEVIVSGVDEDAHDASDTRALVAALARAKAEAVAARAEATDALVLGCDSLLDIDGVAEGKPADLAEARARIRAHRGRTGVLCTGHHLIDARTGAHATAVATTEVRFAAIDDDEVEAYLATGEPLAVAGAFTLDGYAAPFVESITGDHGTVIGLSLPLLRTMLASTGVRIVDLWA